MSRLIRTATAERAAWYPLPAKASAKDADFVWTRYRKELAHWKTLEVPSKSRRRRRRVQCCNHWEANHHLVSKRGLFNALRAHCESGSAGVSLDSLVPETYILNAGEEGESEAWAAFADRCSEAESGTGGNVWILKPSCGTNRGTGIVVVSSMEEVRQHIASAASGGKKRRSCWVVQKYIERPLLVRRRKFDMRLFVLVVQGPGRGPPSSRVRGYLHREGYLRTSARRYSLAKLGDRLTHLTNDAVQCKSESYGRYEAANKLSFAEFATILEKERGAGEGARVEREILPAIRRAVTCTLCASAPRLNPNAREGCFELYGFDFMLDDAFQLFLIEVN